MITFSVKRIAVGATVGLSAVFSYTFNLVAQNTFEPSLLVGEWSEAGQCNSSRQVFTSDGRYRWIENQRGKWTTRFQGVYTIEKGNTVAIAETGKPVENGLQVSSLTQTSLSAKLVNEGDEKERPVVTYTRCSVAAVSPASPSTAATPKPSGVQPSQTNSTGVSNTSLATQPIGTAKCSGIQGGNANTRPIQKATLEPRAGGYNLRLTEIKQGTPVESLLELNNQLVVQSARTLGPQGGEWWSQIASYRTPVKVQPTGAFSINMMVSSRSVCDFSGTLQFVGNAQARLFPGSSTQATNPVAPVTPSISANPSIAISPGNSSTSATPSVSSPASDSPQDTPLTYTQGTNTTSSTGVIAQSLYSQGIEGEWVGELIHNSDGYSTAWKYTIKISQNGQIIQGISKSEAKINPEKHYVVKKIQGIFANGVFKFRDIEIVNSNSVDTRPDFKWCVIEGEFKLTSVNHSDSLEGTWRESEGTNKCSGGRITLKKKTDYTALEPKPDRSSLNLGLTSPSSSYMKSVLGVPGQLSNECSQVTNASLKKLIVTESVGSFRVTGLKPAVSAVRRVLDKVKLEKPDLYEQLGNAGMLCVRKVRGGSDFSNHAWGTAIDIKINNRLDVRGDDKTQVGLKELYPYFHTEGFYWGAAFQRKDTEDSMHFEASKELIDRWKKSGEIP